MYGIIFNNSVHKTGSSITWKILDKFGLESALFKVANKDSKRGYAIRIPSRSLSTLQSVVAPHIYPSLLYKIGMQQILDLLIPKF